MTIWNLMKQKTNKTLTENGATTFKSTDSKVLDLFAMGGALRKRSSEDIQNMFSRALAEDKLLAIKCLFYLRDARSGAGERRTFREGMKLFCEQYPEDAQKLVPLIPEFGRWDDLFYLEGVEIDNVIRAQLEKDILSDHPSLLGKWCPSENASSEITKTQATQLRKQLGISSKKYRWMLSTLRAKINVVERWMSQGSWNGINYSQVPSKAALRYKDAFKKHDPRGYNKYLEDVEKGKSKINTSVLFPYEIVKKARTETDQTLELMWKNLPDYTNGNEKGIVVADTSGSMQGLPLDIAVSLAMYFAEKNEGVFKNKFITFSGEPTLQEVTGKTLNQKIRNLDKTEWTSNTDIQKVFDLILETAIEGNVKQKDLPGTIYIVSDMEFDFCASGRTNFEDIKAKYAEAGYKMPLLVFWQVDSRHNNVPVMKEEKGVILVSGASASTFKTIMKKENPYEHMLSVLNSKRYKIIEETLTDKKDVKKSRFSKQK